jgi:GT2 family glycosyltransferase
MSGDDVLRCKGAVRDGCSTRGCPNSALGLTATIAITTKDRKSELSRAIESAVAQTGVSEILVFDDASSDGTEEVVRTRFPSVQYARAERNLGIIGARNRAFHLATGAVVITIDDDCEFQSPDTIRNTLQDFAADPHIGAVAIPHRNVGQSNTVHSLAPQSDIAYAVSEFYGGASAIRRDLFLSLGGYNPVLWRQTEEYDFCTRLLDRGYVVRCGTAAPIFHYESPSRFLSSIIYHNVRGHFIYAWRNVPWPYFPLHAVATAASKVFDGLRRNQLKPAVLGLSGAISATLSSRAARSPVCLGTYRLMRHLRKHGPMQLAAVVAALPGDGLACAGVHSAAPVQDGPND